MKLKLVLLASIVMLLSGCTIVSHDRVFPTLTWYWSNSAKQQREEIKQEKQWKTTMSTNSPTK